MSLRSKGAAVAAMVLLATADPGRVARGQAIGPGFELERSGRYVDAASVYFTTIRSDPTNIPALLGLERTLFVLSRMPELLPVVQNARARQPDSPALRSLELRVYAALNEPDSLEAIARRWAARAPQSEAPYREWGLALADRRMWDEARRAFLVGRRALGGDGTLAIELAELEQRVGNWEASATEWGRAVTRLPDVEPNAASQLADAPAPMHDRVARALTAPGVSVRARRLASEILLTWGQPNEAWAAMEPTLATADTEAPTALRRFVDLAGALTTRDGHRVRGLALARWADMMPGSTGGRARAEAVRELLDGGDKAAARRVLEAHADSNGIAQAALIHLLIADNQLDIAEERLSAPATAITADDRATLRLALARARGGDRATRLDRAVPRQLEERDGGVPPRGSLCPGPRRRDRPHGDDGALAAHSTGIEPGPRRRVTHPGARRFGRGYRGTAPGGGPAAGARRTARGAADCGPSRGAKGRRSGAHGNRVVR